MTSLYLNTSTERHCLTPMNGTNVASPNIVVLLHERQCRQLHICSLNADDVRHAQETQRLVLT